MRSLRYKQGIAMLMALVMLAIASSLAVLFWYDNQLTVARIQHLQQAYQAKHYSQGMLLWGSDILKADYKEDENQHDSNLDPWLQGIQGMAVEDAILSGELTGMNDKFNVNNLVLDGNKSDPHIAYFRQLLLLLQLDIGIADKVVDWIDADQVPEPNGAEDFNYMAKSPGYKTGSKHFQHVKELALLEGMTSDQFNKLSQYVTVLPITGRVPTKMNVNTMSPPLLKSLHTLISNDMALRLHQNNQANFLTINDFFQHESIRYVLSDNAIRSQIKLLASVQTRDLQALSTIQMEGQSFQMYALLKRNNSGEAQVISRSYAPFTTQF